MPYCLYVEDVRIKFNCSGSNRSCDIHLFLSCRKTYLPRFMTFSRRVQLFLFFILQLTEGRKTVGGKLEVKVRVRDPYVNRQIEEVKEKWLVIDQLERRPAPAVSMSNLFWQLVTRSSPQW